MKTSSIILFLSILLTVTLFSCKSTEQIEIEEDGTPVFFSTPPADDEEYLYAVDSHVSSRRDMARRQAVLKANTNMATKLRSKVEALDQIFQEDVSDGEADRYSAAFTLASRQITSSNMSGVTPHQVHFNTLDDGRYECFVLVRMPIGEARQQLVNALSQDDELYIRFKESRAFDELQFNLERLGYSD